MTPYITELITGLSTTVAPFVGVGNSDAEIHSARIKNNSGQYSKKTSSLASAGTSKSQSTAKNGHYLRTVSYGNGIPK